MKKEKEPHHGARSGKGYPATSEEFFWGLRVKMAGIRRIDMDTKKPLAPSSIRSKWRLLENCPVEELIKTGVVIAVSDLYGPAGLEALREAYRARQASKAKSLPA